MLIVKPDYYDQFQCIADQCEFTCCQEWNIAVDEQTRKKWEVLGIPNHTCLKMGGYAIALKEDKKCPFLNGKGLCSLVLQYGEACLSETCHTFPRERHAFSDRMEYALSVGCPEALRLLWEQDSFQITEAESESEKAAKFTKKIPPVQLAIRKWFLQLAGQSDWSVEKSLRILFYLALDLQDMEKKEKLSVENVKKYQQTDILSQLIQAVEEQTKSDHYSFREDTFCEDNELFLDLLDNYRKEKVYLSRIEPAALRAEYYEDKKRRKNLADKLTAFQEKWNSFLPEMRLLLCEEIYAACIIPDSMFSNFVLKLEWIATEYTAVRQWAFLHWDMQGELTQENLCKIVSTVFRITGFSDEDISEYMENSFETAIWDWGYLDLIL